MKFIQKLYRLVLRLYPRRFSEAYADEMQSLFARRLLEPGHAAFVLRELLDLPASILREHVYAIQTGNTGLNPSLEASTAAGNVTLGAPGESPRAAGWEVVLAALPHLVLALLIGLLPVLQFTTAISDQVANLVTLVLLIAAPLVALVLVILRRGRAWAASWYSYAFVAIFIALLRAHEALFPGRGFEYNMEGVVVNVIFPLIFAFFLYSVARRSWLQGLLAALPLSLIIWQPYMESTPRTIIDPLAKGVVMLASWLLVAIAAAVAVRTRRKVTSLLLALLPLLLGGPVIVWLAVYQGGVLPFAEGGPSLRAVAQFYLRTLLGTSALMLAPQLAIGLRAYAERISAQAVWIYRAGMAGLLAVFAGAMGYARQSYYISDMSFQYTPDPVAMTLTGVGYLVFLLCFVLLLAAAFRARKELYLGRLILYYILIGVVPLILLLGIPIRMYDPYAPLPILAPAASAWLAASVWLASHPLQKR